MRRRRLPVGWRRTYSIIDDSESPCLRWHWWFGETVEVRELCLQATRDRKARLGNGKAILSSCHVTVSAVVQQQPSNTAAIEVVSIRPSEALYSWRRRFSSVADVDEQ